MSNETTICGFCCYPQAGSPSEPTSLHRYKPKELITHLRTDHQLDEDHCLVFTANVAPIGTIKIILPPCTQCPVQPCTTSSTMFKQSVLGAHLRNIHGKKSKEKFTPQFLEHLTNGKYFWFHVRRVGKRDSPAFTDPSSYRLAWEAFDQPILDPGDPAIAEAHEDAQQARDGGEHIEHDDIEEAFSQLSIEAPTILDEPMIESEPNEDFEHVIHGTVEHHVTVPSHEFENVSFPMELGLFNCAIVRLVDFPESPSVVACLRCRTIITGTDLARQVREHLLKDEKSRNDIVVDKDSSQRNVRNIETNQNDSNPAGGLEGNTGDQTPSTDSEKANDEEIELDAVDEALDADNDQNLQASDDNTLKDYPRLTRRETTFRNKQLKKYFDSQDSSLHRIGTLHYPTTAIPVIHFLNPAQDAWQCIRPGCDATSPSKTTLAKHSCRGQRDQEYDDEMPPADADTDDYEDGPLRTHKNLRRCRVQRLINGPQAKQFVVVDKEKSTRDDGPRDALLKRFLKYQEPRLDQPLQGPAQSNILLRKFLYHTIWPSKQEECLAFLRARIPVISVVKRQTQKPEHQLLAVAMFIYTHRWNKALRNVDHMVHAHIGNKTRFSEYNGDQVHPFSPIAHKSATHYSASFTRWAVYVTQVAEDPNIDPGLELDDEHIRNGQQLGTHLRKTLNQEPYIADVLTQISTLPDESLIRDPPIFVAGERWSQLVAACLPIQDALHRLLFSLVTLPIDHASSISTNMPLHRFLCLIAWNPNTKSFYQAHELFLSLAQMQWMSRLVIFAEYQTRLNGQRDVSFTLLAEIHDSHLVHDTLTPFGVLQSHLKYSSALSARISLPPNAIWESATRTVVYNGMPFSVDNMKTMLRGIMDQTRNQLEETVLFGAKENIFGTKGRVDFGRSNETKKRIPVYDEMTNSRIGYSYLTINRQFRRYSDSLFNHILRTPSLTNRFFHPSLTPDGQLMPNYAAIQQWLTDVDRLTDLLAVCTYFLGGQPPRAPELTSLRIYNTAQAGRSIFCISGSLTTYTDYDKAQTRTNNPIQVYRVIAYELEELIEMTLTAVKPVQRTFHSLFDEAYSRPFAHFDPLLFTRRGRAMSPADFSHALRDITLPYTGYPWAIRAWRQVIVTIANHELPLGIREMTSGNTIVQIQTAHRRTAHLQNYARIEEGTGRTSTSHDFEKFRAASVEWHRLLGFTHPHIACGVPTTSVGSSETGGVTINDAEQFGKQIADHLNYISEERVQSTLTRIVERNLANILEVRNEPVKIVPLDITVTMATRNALRAHFKEQGITQFRSVEQSQAIHYVLTRQPHPILVILPMGHGKSAIYQVACRQEESTALITIVLVPLTSLAQAAVEGCTKMGLKASRVMAGHNYSAQDESMQSPILVMTYDLFATNSRILDRVRTLAYSKNVARIVIDEAHTLITDSAHRENFNRLYSRIAQLSIPLVFLTGTMPPAEVMKFQEMLSAHTICHVIRLPIDIPNLRYSVNRPHATNDNVKKFIQVVKDELLSNLREKTSERAIIFTRTREFAETIAQELEVAYYHSRADADEKQASLSRWLDKQTTLMEHRLIVATTSLALGIDFPSVTDVWFFGDPFTMIDFAQMAARAGRDGNPARVRLFPSQHTHNGVDAHDYLDLKKDGTCRRDSISRRLNGCAMPCASVPNCVPCDVCENEDEHDAESAAILGSGLAARRIQLRMTRLNLLTHALYTIYQILEKRCPYCALMGIDDQHPFQQCSSHLASYKGPIKRSLREIRDEKYTPGLTICIHCHLPQTSRILGCMHRHLPYVQGDGRSCGLADQTRDLLVSALAAPVVQDSILRHVPSRDKSKSLEVMTSPVTSPPCSPIEKEEQLWVMHFLFIACYGRLRYMPQHVKEVVEADWFNKWAFAAESGSPTASILQSLYPDVDPHHVVRTDDRMDLDPPQPHLGEAQATVLQDDTGHGTPEPTEKDLTRDQITLALFKGVHQLAEVCPYCWMDGVDSSHDASVCPTGKWKHRNTVQCALATTRRGRAYNSPSTCPTCHLPYIKHSLTAGDLHRPHEKDPRCTLSDVIIDVLIGVLSCKDLQPWFHSQFKSVHYPHFVQQLLTPVPILSSIVGFSRLHIILLACISSSPRADPVIQELVSQEWFREWVPNKEALIDKGSFFERVISRMPEVPYSVDSRMSVDRATSMDLD